LNLPPIEESKSKIDLSHEERVFYDALFSYSQSRVEILVARVEKSLRERKRRVFKDEPITNINGAVASVLALIMRLRQAACSPVLVVRSMKRLQKVS